MPDIVLKTLDGTSFPAYLAVPDGKNGPGLLVIHEIFGLNDDMRARCDALAAEGYLALCPDLFWRLDRDKNATNSDPQDWEQATRNYKAFDLEAGVRDLLAALAHARQLPGSNGKVGALGYCLGGRLSFLLAARSDVNCAVSYYGVGLDSFLDEVFDIRAPFLLHCGEQDKLVPPAVQKRVLSCMAKNPHISTWTYPHADHGFARRNDVMFSPDAAQLAQERTIAFLRENLLL